jgi:hypothetical protein
MGDFAASKQNTTNSNTIGEHAEIYGPEQHHHKMTMNDKWLTHEAIHKLIDSRFAFNDGIDLRLLVNWREQQGLNLALFRPKSWT